MPVIINIRNAAGLIRRLHIAAHWTRTCLESIRSHKCMVDIMIDSLKIKLLVLTLVLTRASSVIGITQRTCKYTCAVMVTTCI